MKKTWMVLPLAVLAALTLCGCKETKGHVYYTEESVAATTEETVPATIPADGDPGDITCKGTYTVQPDPTAVVATAGETVLQLPKGLSFTPTPIMKTFALAATPSRYPLVFLIS